MKTLLLQVDGLRKQLETMGPLTEENRQRLEKKLRLEWNFNSNHIEGNTLTYGETELLLIFDRTQGDHEMREYEEMKSHDVALKLVQDLATDPDRTLTEGFSRQLNQVLLVRPFYKEAITPDGQNTRRLIEPGQYKSMPNSVRLQNGEIFHYASPAETPAFMHDLMQWYQKAAADAGQHPAEVAAELHYRFVRIHPFDDGNGRISRLIMNYHLLKNGYPPVIIKSADKKNYLAALNKADVGDLDAFKKYIAKQLLWSYEISIKAARGESIDEAEDWEKKIRVFSKSIPKIEPIERKMNNDDISIIFKAVTVPIGKAWVERLTDINNLFTVNRIFCEAEYFDEETGRRKNIEVKLSANSISGFPECITCHYIAEGFRGSRSDHFNVDFAVAIEFSDFHYTIYCLKDFSESLGRYLSEVTKIKKYYHQDTSPSEVERIISTSVDSLLSQINKHRKV